MVFHDHVHLHLRGIVGEPPEPVGGKLLLFLERAGARGVDADRVAAEPLGRLDPWEVVLDRLCAGRGVGVAEIAQAVAHDEHVRHALVGGSLGQFGEVVGILRLVLEKLVHVFDGVDPELLLRSFRKVEIVELAGEERLVERPFGERDLEAGGRDRIDRRGEPGRCGERGDRGHERAAGEHVACHDEPPKDVSSGRIYRCVGSNTATGMKQMAVAAMATAKIR